MFSTRESTSEWHYIKKRGWGQILVAAEALWTGIELHGGLIEMHEEDDFLSQW